MFWFGLLYVVKEKYKAKARSGEILGGSAREQRQRHSIITVIYGQARIVKIREVQGYVLATQ